MFESPHAKQIIECPPSNGQAFFLDGATVVGSWAFDESLLSGEDFEILIWPILDAIIAVRYSVSFFIFSS